MAKRKKKSISERHFFISRRMSWGVLEKPFYASFFTNWYSLSISIGRPKVKIHGETVPESIFSMDIGIKPLHFIAFWRCETIIWLGK